MIRQAAAADAPLLAAIHRTGFHDAWAAEAFAVLLAQPGVIGWIWEEPAAGFLLARAAADEAEILTLAIMPEARRRGGGGGLVNEALRVLGRGLTRRLFLEVAADNAAALGLYTQAGFSAVGRRPNYYAGADQRTDAIIMSRAVAGAFSGEV